MKRTLLLKTYLFILAFFLGIANVSSQCKSEFFANPDSANHLIWHFENTSTFEGNIQKFEWKFGNEGIDTTNFNPTFTFPSNGDFEVILILLNDLGCGDTMSHMIHVKEPSLCKAEFYFEPDTNAQANEFKYVFHANEFALDTTPQSFTWAVDGQQVSTSSTFNYQFPAEGQYDICLAIVSNSGCTDTICQLTEIKNGPNCKADFNFDVNQALKQVVFQDASQSSAGIFEWSWDFGDGNSSADPNPSHTYTQDGNYNVCVNIKANDSCFNSFCKMVNIGNVQGCQPMYSFIHDTSNTKIVDFKDETILADGSITSWSWDFGDGNFSTVKNPSHTFISEGMYTVCMEINTDKGCTEKHCTFISIGDVSCHAEFGWESTAIEKELSFQNHSFSDTTITSYSWNIEGTNYIVENPTHQFSDTGLFQVSLIIQNLTGCTDTVERDVYVPFHTQNNCQAEFSFFPNSPEGSSWDFSDNSFASTGIQSWNYNTGDGYNYTTPNFVHQYAANGNYNVCLSIQSNDGCGDTICHVIAVEIDTNTHQGGEKLTPIQGCLASFWYKIDAADPLKLEFTSASAHADGGTLSYAWNINGTNHTTQDVQHQFTAAGDYMASLMVSGPGCESEVSMPIKVGGHSNCSVSATFVIDSLNPNRVQFALSGSDNLDGGFWQFGDGKQADQKDPIHEYAGPGFYSVCINAYDSASGCQAQKCFPVEIKGQDVTGNCYAEFDFNKTELTVAFNNKSQGNFSNIHYTFGDGGFSDEPNPSHTYTAPGVYEVCMSIFDSTTNCVANFCKPITVYTDTNDIFCHADFNFFPIGDKKFAFSNESQGNFTEVKWELNGGTKVYKTFEMEHEFATPGHHNVCLSIFDSISGCFNSVCKTIEIVDTNVVNCKADFSFFKGANNAITFKSTAIGSFTNIHFDLGNGKFSEKASFAHTYTKTGHFDVCMAIMDTISGCQDQICKKVAVAPDTVTNFCEAKFDGYIDDNGIAHAQNLSTGGFTNSHWDFGDGFTSFDNNPSHEFKKSGFYKICLNIYDTISGCQASHCEEVNIQLDSADVNCQAAFKSMIIDGKANFENISVGNFSQSHWSFGDATYGTGYNINHTYNKSGVFNVCLAVFDSVSGCQSEICKQITIVKDTMDVFCKAKFEFVPLASGEIQFKDASIGTYTHLHWDLGNGKFANHEDPIAKYMTAGVYPVSLMIWDSINGCQATVKQEVVVNGTNNQTECHAKFNFFPVNDSMVKFNNASTGDFTNIHWEFGDGKFGENQNGIEHNYANGGYYNVCLGIFDSISGCHDFICKDIEIIKDTAVANCKAEFEFFPMNNSEVAFNNISAGTFTNSYWKFGNGTTSYSDHPTINFNASGLYDACLTVFDSISGCQDEFCMKVPLIDDTTTYCDANFGYFVENNKVRFEPKIKGSVTGFVWDFNNGFNSNDSFPTHTFKKDGVYDVCLTVFDSTSGCFNTYCDEISIISENVVIDKYIKAKFSYYLDPADGMVHFKDESVGSPSNWYWDFGDGDSAGVAQNPTYKYEEDGYYEVCLTAKNDNGGQKSICKVISVGDVSNACYAKFDYYANAVTATAHFDNKSLGNITNYEWNFGDSLTSVQFKPTHTYADTGFYAVCLTVSNDSGCIRTFCKEIRVGNSLEEKCLIGCVWPGDANLDLEANHYDILPMGLHYGETGPIREEVSSEWRGHEAQDWSSNLWGDVNNKHGDANGDGIIDITDLEIIKTNFAYSHPWQPRAQSANQLSIDWDADDIDVGETAILVVSIPDSIDVSMYGLGFEIDLDPTVYDYNTIQYDFTGSWLGTEGADLITFGLENENLGQIYIAESRNDHNELTGNGELVTITVTAKSKSTNAGATLTTEGGVNAQGDTVEFSGAEDEANVNSIDERVNYTIKELTVFPNPTKNAITYNLPLATAMEYRIEIYDNVGKLVYSELQQNGGQVTTNLAAFESGIYTVQVSASKVKYMQKVILTK